MCISRQGKASMHTRTQLDGQVGCRLRRPHPPLFVGSSNVPAGTSRALVLVVEEIISVMSRAVRQQ